MVDSSNLLGNCLINHLKRNIFQQVMLIQPRDDPKLTISFAVKCKQTNGSKTMIHNKST